MKAVAGRAAKLETVEEYGEEVWQLLMYRRRRI
jgi:hypothetical protein